MVWDDMDFVALDVASSALHGCLSGIFDVIIYATDAGQTFKYLAVRSDMGD